MTYLSFCICGYNHEEGWMEKITENAINLDSVSFDKILILK